MNPDILDETDKISKLVENSTKYLSFWSGPTFTDPIWMISPKECNSSPSQPRMVPVMISNSISF